MSQIIKKFIADDQVGANKILLENNITLKALNASSTEVDVIGIDASNNINIYDGVGNVVVDCGTKNLLDTSANESVGWQSRKLYDSGALQAIDWQTRALLDTSEISSIGWSDRLLRDSAGSTTFDYSSVTETVFYKNLNPSSDNTQNIGNNGARIADAYINTLKDATNTIVLDVGNRLLKNSSGTTSIDFTSNAESVLNLALKPNADSSVALGGAGLNYSNLFVNNVLRDNNGELTIYSEGGASAGIAMYCESEIINIYSYNGVVAPTYRFWDSSSNYAAIKSPTTLSASYTLTLPPDDGAANEFLQTNGSGVLTWAAASTNFSTESFTLDGTDIGNGYVTVANTPKSGSVMLFVSGLKSKLTTDYTVSGSQVNFSTHTPTLAIGDVVEIVYAY